MKAPGPALFPAWFAWYPMLTLAPGASAALYEALLPVTAPEAGAYVAPHPLVMDWPAGRVKPSLRR